VKEVEMRVRCGLGTALGLVLLLTAGDVAAFRFRAPAPFPRRQPRGLAAWIADLASEDGGKRLAATREIFRLGKDALPALEKAGAKLIVPSHGRKPPPRLHAVYSLLKGLPVNKPWPLYKSDCAYLFLARGWTKPELFALGKRVGFRVLICERPGWPDAEVQVDGKRTPAEVMKAVLITDPKVVSVNLVPAR
jgi:hypothetical protein